MEKEIDEVELRAVEGGTEQIGWGRKVKKGQLKSCTLKRGGGRED